MIIGLETGHPCALQSEAPQTDDGFLSNYAKTFHSKGPAYQHRKQSTFMLPGKSVLSGGPGAG